MTLPERPGPSPARPLKGVRKIVAVASGKGGVGKSTTAMNLAVALATLPQTGRQALRIGLLDADVYGPSQPRMMGVVTEKPASDGARITPVPAHGVRLMSMGFLIDETTPLVWRGPMAQKALLQMLHDVEWGEEDASAVATPSARLQQQERHVAGQGAALEQPSRALDVLVIDMPPGTGDIQLTLAQQAPPDGVVIVSTPQDIALIDARKGLEMFRKMDVPILGLVENMAFFCCPNCGHETGIFGRHGAREMAAQLGVELLAEVPLAVEIRENTDAGRPLVVSAPDSAAAAVYRELAAKVWGFLQAQPAVSEGLAGVKKVVIT